MGSPFSPTGQGEPLPTIPTPDMQQEGKLKELGRQAAGAGGWLGGVLKVTLIRLPAFVLAGVLDLIDEIMAVIFEAFARFEGQYTQGFADLNRAILAQLLGIDIPDSAAQGSATKAGRLGLMKSLGQSLFDTLESEFTASGAVSEDQGISAAQTFAGFLTSYAVREGNLNILLELLPTEHLDTVREIGVQMAENLGLGRLARHAFSPMIDVLVGTPVKWHFNSKYRTKNPSEAQAVTAFFRGKIDRDRLNQILTREGYRDDDIENVILDNKKSLSASDLWEMVLWQGMARPDAVAALHDQGWSEDDADTLLQVEDLKRVDARQKAMVDDALTAFRIGELDADGLSKLLDETALSDKEKQWVRIAAAARREDAPKQPTLGQMEQAYLDEGIALDDWYDYLARQNYSAFAQEVLTVILLTKSKKAEDKAEKEAAKARAKAAKGKK